MVLIAPKRAALSNIRNSVFCNIGVVLVPQPVPNRVVLKRRLDGYHRWRDNYVERNKPSIICIGCGS